MAFVYIYTSEYPSLVVRSARDRRYEQHRVFYCRAVDRGHKSVSPDCSEFFFFLAPVQLHNNILERAPATAASARSAHNNNNKIIILLHQTYILLFKPCNVYIIIRRAGVTRRRVFYASDGYRAARAIAIIYNNILRKRARKNRPEYLHCNMII